MDKRKAFDLATLGVGAIIFAYAVLALAQFGTTGDGYCNLDVTWYGCVLRKHENLAGGLVGGSMTIIAAWIAWTAVQDQISADRVARTHDSETADGLLREAFAQYAESVATAWKLIEEHRMEETPSIEQVRSAVAFIASELSDPVVMAMHREMVTSLPWETRAQYGHILDALEDMHAYSDPDQLGDCSEAQQAIRRLSHFIDGYAPEGHEYFAELPQGSPKAWTLGGHALHAAGSQP